MKKNKLKKVFIFLFSFLFIASATVAGGVLLSGSSYSVPVSESSGEEIQDNENLTNVTANATEPLNDGNWTDSGNYDTTFAGGTGTESDPYLISTARQLAGLAYWTNISTSTTYNGSGVYYRQTADIDVSAYWWDAIGTSTSSTYWFQGHYDGGAHTVSGVFTQAGSTNYQGFFGYVRGTSSTNRAEISNIGVINSNIQGYQYVGGIVGYSYYANITNCYNTSSVTGSASYVGGIVGYNYSSSTVTNSYNIGSVTGVSGGVGGVVGCNRSSSTVTNSYNIGSVTGSSSMVGGVVGYNSGTSARVNNTYNIGNVSGTSYVAGIVGYNYNGADVYNSFNTGSVTGTGSYVGAIVGRNYSNSPTVYNCYWGGNCTQTSAYGSNSGTVSNCEQFSSDNDPKTLSWYSSTSGNWDTSYPWDFETVWGITEYANDGYPYLLGVGNIVPDNTDLFWTDSGNFDTTFAGGSGTESDPYLISTARQLAGLAYLTNISTSTTYNGSNVYYLQTADIDLSDYWWYAIGRSGSNYYFRGHYDGGGYTVSGIYTQPGSSTTYNYQGLFGYVRGTSSTNRAEISNVGVINSNIQGYGYVAGIAGRAYYTNITNCYNTGIVTGSGESVGGVVGLNDSFATVTNSYNTGTVTGTESVGGVVGKNSNSVTNSYNTGTVIGTESVGGVVGYNINYSSTVSNSYNTGTVTGSSQYIGGVVGQNSNSVTNSYNTGTVTGTESVGGVVGYNINSVTNSYNTGSVTGSSQYIGGVVGRNTESVTNSYNTGSVKGTRSVGGVVGWNISASLANSYNTGSVTGSDVRVGGVVGYNYNSSTVLYCYYGGGCPSSVGGIDGADVDGQAEYLGTITTDAKTESWYSSFSTVTWDSSYPWDFENYWSLDSSVNDGYPILIQTAYLTINIITAGRVTPNIEITTVGGELNSDNVLSASTTGSFVIVNFENTNSSANVHISFIDEPTSESALNSATYLWNLTSGTLNVYVYQRRVVTYHSNNESDETVSYEYIGNETITTISNSIDAEEGYHFTYWNTSSAGTGTNYAQNVDITSSFNYDLDLYAQWSGDVFNITFNHGNGTSTTYYLKYGTGLYGTNPGDNSASAPLEVIAPITRDGYTFHGYYTGENGTGEQIVDENGNVVGSPTFTLSPTTIYAYWTVNVPAYYDSTNGYWYIEYGKMPQTKVTDSGVINALNGDSTLTDSDGVTISPNVYYFAGIMLSAKVYNGNEYCNFQGDWYLVEPIKWRLDTDLASNSTEYVTTDTLAVMDTIVYVGAYSQTALEQNQGYVSANNGAFSSVQYFLNNFNITEKGFLVDFSANSQHFTTTGPNGNESSTSSIFLSSQDEISNICGNYECEFSDLVTDYLSSPYGNGEYYFLRDLGNNLNNVVVSTESGGIIYQRPTYILGMRLTIKVTEFVCV